MATYKVTPSFNRITNQATFPADSVNAFMREEIYDSFNFYQSQFGVYNYMRLTDEKKYVLHTMHGTPLLWQPHNSCSWDETGSIRMGRREITPVKAKINEQFCYDEMFNSAFKHFLQWNGRGPLSLNANGIAVINALSRTLAENATLGAHVTLTAGQMYDVSAVTFNSQTPATIRDLFARTIGTTKGWLELLRTQGLVPEYSHLNVSGAIDTLNDINGKRYIGDPIVLFDNLREAAPFDLKAFMDEGGVIGSASGDYTPIFLVSLSVYAAVAESYRKQCVSVTCINPRLSRREFTQNTNRGNKPVYVYYIDDVPVVPIAAVNQYDKYLEGSTHFAGIVSSGNINLGASFDELPDVGTGRNVGMLMELDTSAKNYGNYYFLAHSLFGTHISDTNFISATQVYAE